MSTLSCPEFPTQASTKDRPFINFMRIGCPTHTTVHVPEKVALLKSRSQRNLEATGDRIENLIRERGPGYRKTKTYASKAIKDLIWSVKLPELNFKDIKRSQNWFVLMHQDATGERERIQKEIKAKCAPRTLHQSKSEARLPPIYVKDRLELVDRVNEDDCTARKAFTERQQVPFAYPRSKRFALAVKRGQIDIVDTMIAADRRFLNTVDSVGQNCVHWAAMRNDTAMLKYLQEYGVKLDLQDSAGRTPLHIAAMRGSCDVLQLLLSEGADPYSQTITGKTAMDLAKPESFAHAILNKLLAETLDTESSNPTPKQIRNKVK